MGSTRLAALGRHCATRPWSVLRTALLVVVLAAGAASVWGGGLNDMIRVSGSESDRALQFQIDSMPYRLAVTGRVVLVADHGRIDEGRNRRTVADLVDRIGGLPRVGAVDGLFNEGMVSPDHRATLIDVVYSKMPDSDDLARLEKTVAAPTAMRGEVGGMLPEVAADQGGGGEMIGFIAAMVILLIAFGSVVAAGLPLLTAVAGLTLGVSGVVLLAGVADVSSMAPSLAGMIGLGVGIDYALLIIGRYRHNLADGMQRVDAVSDSVATAGHSVVIAGGIVVISICGLAVTGVELLTMMGVATALCVAATVAAALTVLPATLSLLGDRLEAGRFHRRGHSVRSDESAVFRRLAAWSMRHKVGAAVGATLLLVTLAGPALALHIGYNDASAASTSTSQRRAYDLVTRHFGEGWNTMFQASANVVDGPPELRSENAYKLARAIHSTPGVAFVWSPHFGYDGEQATVDFVTTTPAQSDATRATLAAVRARVADAMAPTGVAAYVGGATATRIDFAERVSDRLWMFVGTVVGLSMLLIFAAFRSIAIALKAAVMNLLSIAAAYGVVVAVFQWGWGNSLLGLDRTVPIDAYVPVFLFAILFGLSMDYEVFILSNIREVWDRTGDNHEAVLTGVARTAKVVTSAGLIMVGVFAGFLFGGDAVVKMFGVGLTTAIVLDVTVVRMILLPATMELLGHWNWWPGTAARGAVRTTATAGATP